MKYLLDTHAFLWAISAPASLSATARQKIEDLQKLGATLVLEREGNSSVATRRKNNHTRLP
jgi:hypothetical protein